MEVTTIKSNTFNVSKLNHLFSNKKVKNKGSISEITQKDIEASYSYGNSNSSSPILKELNELIDDDLEEALPNYDCSLNKDGIVLLKWEKIFDKNLPKGWNATQLNVEGTLITSQKVKTKKWISNLFNNNINDINNTNKLSYIFKWNIENMKVVSAPDVNDRLTFRVIFNNKSSCLIRANKLKEAQLWVDTLQSAANIADDLDSRICPVFYTLPPRNRFRYREL